MPTTRKSLPTLSLTIAVLAVLLVCASTAAAQGPDVSVSNLSGASIFSGAQPAVSTSTDPNAVELGLRFESSVPVAIEGIRFFKGQGDLGTHIGHLWTSSGALLASATFTEETAYGWQAVKFAKPVVIEPHTVYVASYYAPTGGYAFTHYFFEDAPYVSGPITALQGVNGVYKYGGTSEFPTETYDSSNYYADIIYSTVVTAGQQATFSVDTANAGTATTGTTTLKDQLPAGLSWTQDDPSACSIQAGTLTCNFGTLEAGAGQVVHLSATTSTANCNQVTRTGVLTSTATATDSSTEDTDTLDKSQGASVVVNCPVPTCPVPTTSYPSVELTSPYALFALDGVKGKQQGTLAGTTVNGSVAVASGASLLSASLSTVTGNLFLENGGSVSGPLTIDGTTHTGTNLGVARLVAVAVNALAGTLKANFSYPSITSSTTVTGVSGLNVVSVKGNISLSNAALTLNGPANAYFVIDVGGSITLSGNGAIKVAGSAMSSRVLVNMTSGAAINTGPEDIVEGTLLAPASGGSLAGGFGDLLLGANFTFAPGAQVGLQSCQS